MRELTLQNGSVALVDDEDYEYLRQFKWRYYNGYAIRSISRERKNLFMHREILSAPKGLYVDHIDMNRLNNVRSNLRLATASQNHANTNRACGLSQFKGVGWHKYNGLWRAYITVNGKQRHVGYFKDEHAAAVAYNEAAVAEFGEFARLNITPEEDSYEAKEA